MKNQLKSQLTMEIKEGECQECGMVGLLIARYGKYMCEGCELDLEQEEA